MAVVSKGPLFWGQWGSDSSVHCDCLVSLMQAQGPCLLVWHRGSQRRQGHAGSLRQHAGWSPRKRSGRGIHSCSSPRYTQSLITQDILGLGDSQSCHDSQCRMECMELGRGTYIINCHWEPAASRTPVTGFKVTRAVLSLSSPKR